VKYYGYHDYRGGGIFSGRRTAAIVAAGAVAKKLLELFNIRVYSYVVNIGGVTARVEPRDDEGFRRAIDESPVKCPDSEASRLMENLVARLRSEGDSVGSIVETTAFNVPPGLGDPPLETLDSDLARLALSIPGAKGIEFGAGFRLAGMRGSEANDQFSVEGGRIVTLTNNAGGINGGISNGMPVVFRTVFKPPSTIRKRQRTVDLSSMKEAFIEGGGRHDPVIGPRAAPVLEAVASIVLADHLLRWASWRGLGLRRREEL
jgi:chorismate synthase